MPYDFKEKAAGGEREQKIIELTRYMMHKHYCENDEEALIERFADPFVWFGTAEHEYAQGAQTVAGIFRQFSGQVIRCNISDEQYTATEIGPDVFLCTGRLWIATDPDTQTYLRVHQRVTMVFKWNGGDPRCCHIHISNPYTEMTEEDVGFPTGMARQSYEYMQECLAVQRKQIEEQTAELASIYNTVPCMILRILRTDRGYSLLTCNQALAGLLGRSMEDVRGLDWSRGYCEDVLEEDGGRLREALENLEKPGDCLFVDYRVKHQSGNVIYLSSTNTLLSDGEGGRLIQRIAFDNSKRVEMENVLKRMSFEDSLTGLFNRNKFNQDMDGGWGDTRKLLGVACFDINGLKTVNDRMGHSAGDDLIRRAAKHIREAFAERAYRVGGDEFVAAEDSLGREAFEAKVHAACQAMAGDGISVSAGYSWRKDKCSFREQVNEADRRMYEEKKRHYSRKENDRRKRTGESTSMKHFNIAIDGPAGAGKSTIARMAAKRLGFVYVDTGAMYRAMALYFLRKGIDPHDEEAVCRACGEAEVSIRYQDGAQQVILNGENVTGLIRTEEVGNTASTVSAYMPVREKLTELQQSLAARENVVMDGRDIGTCVLPRAEAKIYLTASVQVRAQRRFKELQEKGVPCRLEDIEKDIADRDYKDMHREHAPLRQAEDAVLVDSSQMTIEQVAEAILGIAGEKGWDVSGGKREA